MRLIFVYIFLNINSGELSELYKPLQDSLIKRCVELVALDKSESDLILKAKSIWAKVSPKPRKRWLPTGSLVRGIIIIYIF